MYVDEPVPIHLHRYVRRILVADQREAIDVTSAAQPTGYTFFGFNFRGSSEAIIGDRIEFATPDSVVHVSGQILADNITVRYWGLLGHALVEFKALGLFELLGIFGENTVDRCQQPKFFNPDLAKMFSPEAGFVQGKSKAEALDLMISVLTDLANNPTSAPDFLHRGLTRMEDAGGQIRLGELCEELDISQRHFAREFGRYVGQTPKRFCRILQVNRALQAMIDEDGEFLAGIAADAGFSDQAHFNRTFKQHLLMNPLSFLNGEQMLLRTFLAERA